MRKSKKSIRNLRILVMMLALMLIVIPIGSDKAYAESESEKDVTGLGVSPISNPKKGGAEWNMVYYCNKGEVLLFNVLNKHETNFGGTTLLLDCVYSIEKVNAYNAIFYSWENSNTRSRLRSFVSERFTAPEKNAIFLSTKSEPAEGDVYPLKEGNSTLFEFDPLEKDTCFLLDASEAMNPNYGFVDNEKVCPVRHKIGANSYWLRSTCWNYSDYTAYVDILGAIKTEQCKENFFGLSPAMNIDLNNILFSTLVSGEVGKEEATYKLTIIDNKKEYGDKDTPFKTSLNGSVERKGNIITVPFKLSGKRIENATQISYLVTDKSWQTEGAKILKYGKMDIFSGNVTSEGVGTFELPDGCEGESGNDYYVYMFAEDVNGGNLTDYASSPVELYIKPANISADVISYDGYYDGKAHGLTIKAAPKSATIKFGTEKGTYDLDKSPEYIAPGKYTVYYQVSADGYESITGSENIVIDRKPVTVKNVTAEGKEYDGTETVMLNLDDIQIAGLIEGDNVNVNATGKFADKNAGEDKLVRLNYTFSGEAQDNYIINYLSQMFTTASIGKKPVVISGITAENKSYDATDYAKLNFSNLKIDGIVEGEDVLVTAEGSFENPELVEVEQKVNIKNMELTGNDSDNYVLAKTGQQEDTEAKILQAGEPVIKVSGQNYIYDGDEHTINVEVKDTVEGAKPENVVVKYGKTKDPESMDSEPPKYKGVGQYVIYYYVEDSNASPTYTVTDSSPIRILKRPVSVASVKGIEKVYDGTTSIESDFSNAEISGRIGNDDISVNGGTAVFADASAGEEKDVILGGMTLKGDAAGNYKLSPSATVKGRITKRPIVVSGVTACSKVYDGTTDVTLNTERLKIDNVISGDDITVTATGSYEDANSGSGKVVNLSYEISGESAENYYIDTENSQMSATATINKKELEIEEIGVDTIYDGKEYSATVNVKDAANVKILYGETEDNCNLTECPKVKDAGSKLIYYTIDTDDENYYGSMGNILLQISPRSIVVSGIKGKDKVYDGKVDAELITDKMKLDNIVAGDKVSVKATGKFENAEKGNDKKVEIKYELTGDSAANYRIDLDKSQKELTANITEKEENPSPEPKPTPKPSGETDTNKDSKTDTTKTDTKTDSKTDTKADSKTDTKTASKTSSKTILLAKGIASGSNAVKISWNNVKADRYVIYLAKGKTAKFKKVKTLSGKKYSFKKKKLVKKSAYKFYVAAQKKNGKKYKTIAKSKVGYFFTGNVKGKYTNPKTLKLKNKSITLSVGKKKTLKATVTKVKKNKKLATSYAKKLRYISSNKKVATVNSKGKITAKSKGSCKIYVQTINGIWKTCKVKVK